MKSSTRDQHSFARIEGAELERSQFNRGHPLKTTFDAGFLIPIFCDEALPGDTFSMRMHTFARLATPTFPFMDNLHFETFFFSVPNRLLWDNWEKFMGAQDDPGDSIAFTIPQMVSPGGDTGNGSLSDYIGIPTGASGAIINLTHSSLWHRAYNLIYNTWFRSEDLQNSVVVDTDDGPDTYGDYVLLRRGKRHDYFTSCLPSPQKGAAVQLPLGTRADVKGIGVQNQTWAAGPATVYETGETSSSSFADFKEIEAGGNNEWRGEEDPNNAGFPNIYADLSTATAATVNQLRQSFQIQRLLERDQRGGTRYTEIIRSHFGVVSPDQRLQRPEYLGGGHQAVSVVPVQNNTQNANADLGDLAGYGTSSGSGHSWTRSFTEHCTLIGLCCVRADLTYQQGLPRMFSRSTRYDYYFPAFAHLGEQSVLNKEIWADGSATDELVFGYQGRFEEYRYKPGITTADMRSDAEFSVDVWHLAQDFATLPVLDATFIQETPPLDRVIAVTTEPHFKLDAYFDMKCARPMPTYSTPGLIDHF